MPLRRFLSRAPVTIDRAVVGPNTVTGFPTLLSNLNLPSEMFAASGGIQDSAGDVRFSSDAEGLTELPRTIVHTDKANGEIVVRVGIPVINGSSEVTDTQIYVWWNNESAGEPGVGSPSYSNDVYNGNYYGVFDFENSAAGWKGIRETSKQYCYANAIGTIATAPGHIPGLTALAISSSFGMDLNEYMHMADFEFELHFWSHFQGWYSTGTFMQGYNNISVEWASSGLKFGYSATATERGQGAGGVTVEPNNAWQYHCIKISAANNQINFWRQGQPDPGYGNYISPLQNMGNLGGNSGCPTFLISGLKLVRSGFTPDTWQAVIFNNESNLANFASAGAVEGVSTEGLYRLEGIVDETSLVTIVDRATGVKIIDNELVGVDGVLEFEYQHSQDISVDVLIRSLAYEQIEFQDVLDSIGKTVFIDQALDRVYYNP